MVVEKVMKINNIKTDLSKFWQVSFFNYLMDNWGTLNPISPDKLSKK